MAAVTKIQRYLLESDVLSVADTTDVSVFANATRANEVVPLPTSCLIAFAALHAVFNQMEREQGWYKKIAKTSTVQEVMDTLDFSTSVINPTNPFN